MDSQAQKYRAPSLLWLFRLFLFTAALAHHVHGQEYITFRSQLDFVRNQVDWKLGPFKVHPVFQFDLGYDNNIYSAPESLEPVEDYVATFTPQFTFYLPYSDWLIMSFQEIPQYVYYFDTPEERAFSNGIVPELRLRIFRNWALSGRYRHLRSKLRVSMEIDRRIFQEIEGQTGSLFYETIRGTAVGIAVSVNRLRYEAAVLPDAESSIATELNREEFDWLMEFYYRILSASRLFVSMRYSEYNFASPEARFRDSYSFQAMAGIRFPLTGETTGTLALGYKQLVPRNAALKGYRGLVGNTDLHFRRGRFGFRISYVRDTPFTYGEGIYFIDNRLSPGLSYYPIESIRLDYDFSFGRGDYPETFFLAPEDGTGEAITRKDRYQSHSAAVVVRLVGDIGIGLMASYWKRASNYRLIEMDRLFFGLYLTNEF